MQLGGRAGAIVLGLAVVVVAGAVAAAAVAGGDGAGDEPSTPDPASDAALDGATPDDDATPDGTTAPDVADTPDALCVAYEEMAAAVAAIGTADTAAEREAYVLAQLTFYGSGGDSEPEPDAAAFRSMAAYFEAWRVFYEARGWRQAGLEDVAAVPQPPTDGSGVRSRDILAERCGVDIVVDDPA
jgi:hypothetical protein